MTKEQIGVEVDYIMIISFTNYYQEVVQLHNKLNYISEKLDKLMNSDDIDDRTKEKIKSPLRRINNYSSLLEQIEDDIIDYIDELKQKR